MDVSVPDGVHGEYGQPNCIPKIIKFRLLIHPNFGNPEAVGEDEQRTSVQNCYQLRRVIPENAPQVKQIIVFDCVELTHTMATGVRILCEQQKQSSCQEEQLGDGEDDEKMVNFDGLQVVSGDAEARDGGLVEEGERLDGINEELHDESIVVCPGLFSFSGELLSNLEATPAAGD